MFLFVSEVTILGKEKKEKKDTLINSNIKLQFLGITPWIVYIAILPRAIVVFGLENLFRFW